MLDTKGNRITYFGHSTFLLATPSGQTAIIDPWIQTNPLCPDGLKKIAKLDAIFLTHSHSDHNSDVLALAKQHRPLIVVVNETARWLAAKGFEKEARPMGMGGTQNIGEFEITMTFAGHSNSIDDGGKYIVAGEPAGYVIRMPGGFSIYHAGDTCVFGDMKLIADLYKPDVAMLPIGSLYTMGPREAAYATRLLGVQHVIPMHYGTWPGLTGTLAEFEEETKAIAGLTVHAMKPGEILGAKAGGVGAAR